MLTIGGGWGVPSEKGTQAPPSFLIHITYDAPKGDLWHQTAAPDKLGDEQRLSMCVNKKYEQK